MIIGAASCGDTARVTGPFRPVNWPAKMVLDSAPAPAELKLAKALPTSVSGANASRAASGTSLRPSSSLSLSGSASAADPVGPLVATSIPFHYEQGPFANPVSACEDCYLGEQDENGNGTGRGFPIGFDFSFYGNTYREFRISTNGFIGFNAATYDGCCTGGPLPAADEPNNIIAAAWSDLKYIDASDFGRISFETRGEEPHRRLVVDFNDVEMWSDPNEKISAQIVLYEGTNVIEIHTLKNAAVSNGLTQGVENADGTAAAFLPNRVETTFDPAAGRALDRDGVRFAANGEVPNYVPTVNAGGNAGDHYEGVEGKLVSFEATGSDADNDNLTYAWDFNTDGVTDAEGAKAEHSFDDDGNYPVKVTVSDGKGGVGSATVEVRVANAAPTAELKSPDSVDEGSSIALAAENVSDAPADLQAGFEFAFDCGTGFGEFGSNASTTCATEDNGTLTVGVKVRDKNGWEKGYTKAVTVRNVAPWVDAGQSLTARSGDLVGLSGRFTDAGHKDRVWRWKWAAASSGTSPSQGVVNPLGEAAEEGTIPGLYRACTPGTQQVTLEVTDKDGAPSLATATVVVAPAPAEMQVKGSQDVDGGGGQEVTVFLFSSPTFDATTIDPASLRLTNGSGRGTPLGTLKSKGKKAAADGGWDVSVANLNGDALRDVKLGFSRSALIANGDLNASTTSLTLTGRAGSCLNVTATAPVNLK